MGGRRDSLRQRLVTLRNSITSSRSSFSSISSISSSAVQQLYGEVEGSDDDLDLPSPPSSPSQTHYTQRSTHFTFEDEDDHYRSFPGRASFYGSEALFSSSNTPEEAGTNNDEAIQFTLSIDLNGRKYTATRALPSFVKLRNDLLRELSCDSSRGIKLQMRRLKRTRIVDSQYQIDASEDCDTKKSTPEVGDRMNNNTPQSLIPELPIGNSNGRSLEDHLESGSMSIVGFAGRGFTRLQATLCSYCPAMENWLRVVTDLVPFSPSLQNFLWEPIVVDPSNAPIALDTSTTHPSCSSGGDVEPSSPSSNNSAPVASRRSPSNFRKSSLRSSVLTLGSINESWLDEEGSDEEECS